MPIFTPFLHPFLKVWQNSIITHCSDWKLESVLSVLYPSSWRIDYLHVSPSTELSWKEEGFRQRFVVLWSITLERDERGPGLEDKKVFRKIQAIKGINCHFPLCCLVMSNRGKDEEEWQKTQGIQQWKFKIPIWIDFICEKVLRKQKEDWETHNMAFMYCYSH